MYESFEPWHLRDDYKVKKVHAHSPPLSKKNPPPHVQNAVFYIFPNRLRRE